MNRRLHKYLLFAYALFSSVFLGGLIGFLVIYPMLQILFDKLGINYGYNAPRWVDYLVFVSITLSIVIFIYVNWKRYLKQLRRKDLI